MNKFFITNNTCAESDDLIQISLLPSSNYEIQSLENVNSKKIFSVAEPVLLA